MSLDSKWTKPTSVSRKQDSHLRSKFLFCVYINHQRPAHFLRESETMPSNQRLD